jgi:hypothetical protein
MDDKGSAFDYMIKEYELLYSKFEMHYNAVEKTISLYLLVTGAVFSANGFIIKDWAKFSIFNLSDFQILSSLFVSLIGVFTIMKVIEHRILIIAYVKSVNLNRKWFIDRFPEDQLREYAYFEATIHSPKFYKPFRHFFWEIAGISAINSLFVALFFIGIFKGVGVTSKHYLVIDWMWLIAIAFAFTTVMIIIYKKRGEAEERGLNNRR